MLIIIPGGSTGKHVKFSTPPNSADLRCILIAILVNNYIVRSYRDVIVVITNTAARRTNNNI